MNQIDPKLSIIGNRVLAAANIPNDKKFGEIIAILMIISIILTLIRVIQECNKIKADKFLGIEKCKFYGQEIQTYSRRKSLFTKRRIKKILRQQMNGDDYYKYSLLLTEALLVVGENITDDDVLILMEQANV